MHVKKTRTKNNEKIRTWADPLSTGLAPGRGGVWVASVSDAMGIKLETPVSAPIRSYLTPLASFSELMPDVDRPGALFSCFFVVFPFYVFFSCIFIFIFFTSFIIIYLFIFFSFSCFDGVWTRSAQKFDHSLAKGLLVLSKETREEPYIWMVQ